MFMRKILLFGGFHASYHEVYVIPYDRRSGKNTGEASPIAVILLSARAALDD